MSPNELTKMPTMGMETDVCFPSCEFELIWGQKSPS